METDLPLFPDDAEVFTCPGERQQISRSLHLARLASGFAGCRECEHRDEFGSLPKFKQTQIRNWGNSPGLIFGDDSTLRGMYLNVLTRDRMRELVLHLVNVVDRQRRMNQPGDYRSQGPLQIVVGHDSRESSADLAVGMVEALKLSAAEMVDVGQVSRPIFDYAVHHSSPHIGLFVTGGVLSPAWNGLDIVDAESQPYLDEVTQAELERLIGTLPTRIERSASRYQPAQVIEEYIESLSQQFYALRPLRIAVNCPDPILAGVLETIFAQTPCDVRFVVHSLDTAADPRAKLLTDFVCEQHLDLGFIVGTDGRSCQVIDETGTVLLPEEIARLICSPFAAQLSAEQLEMLEVTIPQESSEKRVRTLQREFQILAVVDHVGRGWFLKEIPHCDALLSLAKILGVLSLSERPVSIYRKSQPVQKSAITNPFFERFQRRPE